MGASSFWGSRFPARTPRRGNPPWALKQPSRQAFSQALRLERSLPRSGSHEIHARLGRSKACKSVAGVRNRRAGSQEPPVRQLGAPRQLFNHRTRVDQFPLCPSSEANDGRCDATPIHSDTTTLPQRNGYGEPNRLSPRSRSRAARLKAREKGSAGIRPRHPPLFQQKAETTELFECISSRSLVLNHVLAVPFRSR